MNLRIINPHRVSLLCWWHYQLAVTFNNERVNIIFEAIKFTFISPCITLWDTRSTSDKVQIRISVCLSSLCRPVQTFQNIQIFSLCLTGLRLAYQTSCRWNMWLLLYPPFTDVWTATSPVLRKRDYLPIHCITISLDLLPSEWKCSKTYCIGTEGRWKAKPLKTIIS